jgi:lysophospholipase L1-like esterase
MIRDVIGGRRSRGPRVAVVAAVLAGSLWSGGAVRADPPGTTFYLSVGDSLAQGYQPIGGPHTNSPDAGYAHGYANELFKTARDGAHGTLRLVKLGCGGESTATMIADSRCSYSAGSQLDAAVEFLDAHRGDVAFVTIDLGANDVFIDCGGDPVCAFAHISQNLPIILSTLRAHAGPGVPIVGMTYYAIGNVAWFQDPEAGEAAAADTAAFNAFLTSLYASAGALVADVGGAFAITDFTTTVVLPGVGPVPLSVYNTCTLTWVCASPPLGPDVHANNEGYRVIADAFGTALGL